MYFDKSTGKEDLEFKVGDHVKIQKYKNIFTKAYVPYGSKEVFMVKKIKNTVLWNYVISDLKGEKTVGSFCEKE